MSTDAIRRLWHRLQMLVGRSRVTVVDDSGGVQLLQVRLLEDETKDGALRVAEYGFTSNPPIGTDAIVLFLAGERTNGVVLGTNNQAFRMRGLASGEVAIFDNQGRSVLLAADGIKVQGASSPVQVETTADVVVTSSSGNIQLSAPAGRITLAASDVRIQATTFELVSTTAQITATMTTLTGMTDIAGQLKVNDIDLGPDHIHSGGTLTGDLTGGVRS